MSIGAREPHAVPSGEIFHFTDSGAAIAGVLAAQASLRKPLSLSGLGLAFVATMLFCFGKTPWVLIIARAFQGLAAPMINIPALVLIADSVRPDEIGSWYVFLFNSTNSRY